MLNNFGAVNSNANTIIYEKGVVTRPGRRMESHSETYNLAKRLKCPPGSIKIILHKDSTFEAINIPDCLSDGFRNPVAHRLLHTTGKWGVEKIGRLEDQHEV